MTVFDASVSEADLDEFSRAIWADDSRDIARIVSEAKLGLRRIMPILKSFQAPARQTRILDVGAGSMLLAGYLASKGFDVSALEPLTAEFTVFAQLQNAVLDHCEDRGIVFERIHTPAEDYTVLDTFDLIYSIHVLEHTHDPLVVLDNAYASLRPGGSILALCPNYEFPYEPHFRVFLVGRSKRLNEMIYRSKVNGLDDLWAGLSFLTYSQLRRHLRTRGLAFRFAPTMVYEMFERLGSDGCFFERMPNFIRRAYLVLDRLHLLGVLRVIPPRFQSPMEVIICKPR